MNSEIDILNSEIAAIRSRITKCERRIAANKVPFSAGESEQDRKDRLIHILGKKEIRLGLLVKGEEV
jgi:predicted RNA polymerase sigma factor